MGEGSQLEFWLLIQKYMCVCLRMTTDVFSLLGPLEKGQVKNEALRELRVELSRKHQARGLDGFGLYL